MNGLDHALGLLRMAEKDFAALKGMTDAETFADEVFGFHAQQAAEKALKAWLAGLDQEYPLTHNLATLLGTLARLECDVAPHWDLVEYNPFGVQFRYEAMEEADEPLDRPATVRAVEALISRVSALLTPAPGKAGGGEPRKS